MVFANERHDINRCNPLAFELRPTGKRSLEPEGDVDVSARQQLHCALTISRYDLETNSLVAFEQPDCGVVD